MYNTVKYVIEIMPVYIFTSVQLPRGGTLNLKWREWSNGGQKAKPQKIPQASNKTPKRSLDQKLTPPPQKKKNPMQNFWALNISENKPLHV